MTIKSPWYEEWFNEDYLLLYSHRDQKDTEKQINLIEKTICLKEKIVVDACCGNGRHVNALAKKGYNVCGFDLSKQLIEAGKKMHPQLQLWVQDARTLGKNKEKYHVVLSLFTSFGYLKNKKEDLKVLAAYYQSLKYSGIFWLDYFNSESVKKKLQSGQSVWKKEEIGGKIFFWKNTLEKNRVIKEIKVQKKQDEKSEKDKIYREEVNLYSKDELVCMLEDTGFSLKEIFGDYSGNAFDISSPRTIFLLEKNEKHSQCS